MFFFATKEANLVKMDRDLKSLKRWSIPAAKFTEMKRFSH